MKIMVFTEKCFLFIKQACRHAGLYGANAFIINESCKRYFDVDWSLLTPEVLYQPPQFGLLASRVAVNGRGYGNASG